MYLRGGRPHFGDDGRDVIFKVTFLVTLLAVLHLKTPRASPLDIRNPLLRNISSFLERRDSVPTTVHQRD